MTNNPTDAIIVLLNEREVHTMEHRAYIKANFKVLAETENAIFFEAYGEKCCEINGADFYCNTVEEFYEMIELFGDDTFEE